MLAMVPPDSQAAGRLLSRFGWFIDIEEGDYDGSMDAFEQALAIAQREADKTLELRTFANAVEIEAYFDHGETMLENGLRAVELAPQVDEPRAEVLARYWGAFRQMAPGTGFCRRAAYRPEVAWTCYDYAVALLERNHQGDQELASAMLDEALAISTELAMTLLLNRVVSLGG